MGRLRRRREPLRAGAEGASPDQPEAEPEPDVIDLRFGQPGQCPTCRAAAQLVHIDIARRISRHACRSCDREWWVSEAEPGVELDPSDRSMH